MRWFAANAQQPWLVYPWLPWLHYVNIVVTLNLNANEARGRRGKLPCPGGVVSQTLKNETQLILHSNFFHFSKWSPLLLSLSCAHAKRQRKCRFIFYWSLLLKCRRVHRLYRLTVCVCVRVCVQGLIIALAYAEGTDRDGLRAVHSLQ